MLTSCFVILLVIDVVSCEGTNSSTTILPPTTTEPLTTVTTTTPPPTTTTTSQPPTVITLGQDAAWQALYSPHSLCTNCTLLVNALHWSHQHIQVYLLIRGALDLDAQTTATFLNVYLGDEFIGSVASLATNHSVHGALVPLFSSNRTVRFDNFYPHGYQAQLPPQMAFLLRLAPEDSICGRALVYVGKRDEMLTVPATQSSTDKCYVSVITSHDDAHPVVSLYDWNIQVLLVVMITDGGHNQGHVRVVPGWEHMPFNNPSHYTAAILSNSMGQSTPLYEHFSYCSSVESQAFVTSGSTGFFMGAYPEYSELQLLSRTDSLFMVTEGEQGTPCDDSEECSCTVSNSTMHCVSLSPQLNVKFDPRNQTSATFMLNYIVYNDAMSFKSGVWMLLSIACLLL